MYIGQRVASAHAALARRLAADRAPQARPAALLFLVLGGVLEHQLLGVGVLPHRLRAGRKAVVEQFVHLEQVGRGRVLVSHDQRLYVGARHRILEHQPLRHRGDTLLPPLEDDQADRLPLCRLPADDAVQVILRVVEAQARHRLFFCAYPQEVFAVFLRVPQVHTLASSPQSRRPVIGQPLSKEGGAGRLTPAPPLFSLP